MAGDSPTGVIQRLEVRGVNGDGPTCGCGHRSSLHVEDHADPRRDYFLCPTCAMAAVERYLRATLQEPQGPPPGDYMIGLYRREHAKGHHAVRKPRYCPDCEEGAP